MSIETEFESTITNVQNAYQGLDNLGATIPQNKTIENIKNCLDEIYNNLPKTSYAEGSNITLSNTLKGKLDFENDIVGIGDTSQKSYEGYNIYNPSLANMPTYYCIASLSNGEITLKATHDGEIYYGGVAGSGNGYSTSLGVKIPVKPSTTYRIGASNSVFSRFFITKFNSSDVSLGFEQANPTFTTDANTTYITLRGGVFNATNNVSYTAKIWVYDGSTDKDYEPYVGGTASPNPSYPQDIEVVRGKNIFDKDNANIINSYFLQTDPTISASGNTYRSIYIECKPNTIYTISKVSSARFCIGYTTTTPAVGVSVLGVIQNNTATSITITTGSNAKYLVAFIYHSSYDTLTPQQIYDSIQIEKGSQATSYLPYNTIEVVERGKNLFGLEKRVYTPQATQDVTASINDGKLTASGTSNAHTSYSMSVVTGEKYTIIWKNATGLNSVQVKDGQDGTQYFRNYNTTGLEVITTRTDTLFLNILSSGTTLTIEDVMVVKGEYTSSTIGNYEPYQTPITQQLSLGEYEFAKIGNYVDTIEYDVDEDKVYKNENVNEHIFTENENISLQSINSYGIANFFISHSLGSVSNFALCNYFTLQTSGISVTQEEGFLWQHNGVYFRIKSSTASDVSSFKTWLGSHNTKVKYALAEAVKKPITGTLKDQIKALYYSHSFTGTTIIEIDGQLPLIIKVRALKGN